jgi:hypothetical protein
MSSKALRIAPPALLLPALLLPTLAALLAGCADATGAVIGASAASVPPFGRTLPDLIYSGATGKDCSAVRLEQGKSYCKPPEPPPDRPPFCTRSLGVVDCWKNPEALNGPLHEVADGPRALTPEQDSDRTRRWPGW